MPNRLNRDFRTRRQRLAAVWVAVWGVSAASGVARPAAAASPAARLDQYLSKFESSYTNVRSLRAQFTQSYDWGGRRRVESGTVAFARGGKIDRKSTRLNSSHLVISYAVFCLKKKKSTSLATLSTWS